MRTKHLLSLSILSLSLCAASSLLWSHPTLACAPPSDLLAEAPPDGPPPVLVSDPSSALAASDSAPLLPPRPGCPRASAISPDTYSLSADGVFSATYSHGGGCGAHDYCIGYDDADPNSVKVWMSHIHDGTDRCEALLSRSLQAQLPPSALTATARVLIDSPNGGSRPLPVAPKAALALESSGCPLEAITNPNDVKISDRGVLTATVLHSGGCGKHTYCVGYRYEPASDSTLVWVGHVHDGSDRCKMMIEGPVSGALPEAAWNAKSLTLKTLAGEKRLR